MAEIRLQNIRKVYDKTVVAVENFNLTIADREFVVLVGPSGCGKSTTLRMIAGLEEISSGELYIDGVISNDLSPKDRDVSMVFQNYALFPYMTVFDNIAFGLKLRKEPASVVREKVYEAAEILNITGLLERKPKALSGGQRQRVAIGRAIVRKPKIFLMDEPLSNLDAKLRNQMRSEIIKLRSRLDTTFVYVTHDQTEAMTLGDRIVIMKDGHIMQSGTPQQVFRNPENRFVASFIGSPQMNFFRLRLEDSGQKLGQLHGNAIELPADVFSRFAPGDEVLLGIRPEDIEICGDDQSMSNRISAKVDFIETLGNAVYLHFLFGEERGIISVPNVSWNKAGLLGKEIQFRFPVQSIHLFPITE